MSTQGRAPGGPNAGWRAKVVRYATGSVVATICSELTFVALYGLAHAGTTVSSLLAWLAGAVPNYWLNRRWAWQRTGRADLRREILPYLTIILGTLVAATAATKGADVLLRQLGTAPTLRVTLVAGVFLGVYVVVFGLRYLLLDRLFVRLTREESQTGRGVR